MKSLNTKISKSVYTIFDENSDDYLALDTETTGLDLQHACKPFCVSTCNIEGDVGYWEFDVDPFTRQPILNRKKVRQIKKHIKDKILIFHNSKFDIRGLSLIDIPIYFIEDDFKSALSTEYTECKSFHDTYALSHIFSSSSSHKLKDLADCHLDYSNEDEVDLKNQVQVAGRLVTKYFPGWSKGYNLKGKRETAMDYWLPRAFTNHFNLEAAKDILSQKHKTTTKSYRDKVLDLEESVKILSVNKNKEYACKDAERTILLWNMYYKWLLDTYEEGNKKFIEVYSREKALIPITYQMQSKGITIKDSSMNSARSRVTKKSNRLFFRCNNIAKRKLKKEQFNSKSSKQLIDLLFEDDKGFNDKPVKYTPNNTPKTDKKALEILLGKSKNRLKTKYLKLLLEAKLNDSAMGYLNGYQSFKQPITEGYSVLYPSLNCNGTRTTRFSCSNPNGQNISKISTKEIAGKGVEIPSLRSIFSPTPGKIWYAIDYSQLELRVFAVASQEQSLIDALNNGYDFHEYVACRIFNKPESKITKEERKIAKNVNFAIIFGASKEKVNETAGIDNAYELFAGQFPNVYLYMKKVIEDASKKGFVETLFGYRLEVNSRSPYKGVNYIVQGTAGDIVKNSMIKLCEEELVDFEESHLLLQIHDELLFEKDSLDLSKHKIWLNNVIRAMESSGEDLGIITPVSCEIIENNWEEAQELSLSL